MESYAQDAIQLWLPQTIKKAIFVQISCVEAFSLNICGSKIDRDS